MVSRILFILFLLAMACKDAPLARDLEHELDTESAVQKPLEIDFDEYFLIPKAETDLDNWARYKELKEVYGQLRASNWNFFKNDPKLVQSTIDDFEKSIPEAIQTEPIRSRVLVVKNMYLRLHNLVQMPRTSQDQLNMGAAAFLKAFSILNFQINKHYERAAQAVKKPEEK